MSPTKKAKSQGNSGKEPKLHQIEWRKKTLGETRLSWGPVLLWPTKEWCVIRAALQDKLDRNIKIQMSLVALYI